MIAPRVPSEEEIFKRLDALGFERTGERSGTGEFWLHTKTGRHIQVPDSVQGYYYWLRNQFLVHAEDIANR